MHLTTYGYYSDFVIYPLGILCLAAVGLHAAPGSAAMIEWMSICILCVAGWTLIEYGLHRFAFHHFPIFRQLHQAHHDQERFLVGTPVWLSLPAHLLVVFFPLLLLSNLATASAVTAGVMIGYLWYASVHHMVHHWHTSHNGYLYKLKRRHALHHHAAIECNFGVTTGVWDRIFQTAAPESLTRSKTIEA